ncbi:MAG: ASCH domain-containing protein [Firmicutes bacterium]|nr:ASCH domain-containing protein [Bacillota bacterium]
MKHEMRLQEEYFNRIKNGTKTIEFRLNDEKRNKIQVGDLIEFTNLDNQEILLVQVVQLHKADTFEQLFQELKEIGYTILENAELMLEFYSMDYQRNYGVLGIEIKRVNR